MFVQYCSVCMVYGVMFLVTKCTTLPSTVHSTIRVINFVGKFFVV